MAILTLARKVAARPSISFESLVDSGVVSNDQSPEHINEAEMDQDITDLIENPQDEALLQDASDVEVQALENCYLEVLALKRSKHAVECLCESLGKGTEPLNSEELDRVEISKAVMTMTEGGDTTLANTLPVTDDREELTQELQAAADLAQEGITDSLLGLKSVAPKLYKAHSLIQAVLQANKLR